MPTVHLSLPEKTYRELKQKAAELGIQVTDLIKFFIRMGLENGLAGPQAGRSKTNRELEKKAEEALKEALSTKLHVMGKIREMEAYIEFLMDRLEQLEDMVADIKRELKQREYVAAQAD